MKPHRLNLKLAGDTRPSRKKHRPAPDPADATPPEGMTGDALAFWQHNAAPLIAAGILKTTDRSAFTLLCETFELLEALRRELVAAGVTYQSRDLQKINPATSAYTQTASLFVQMLAQFGMTPRSRQRLVTDPPCERDALGDFLNER